MAFTVFFLNNPKAEISGRFMRFNLYVHVFIVRDDQLIHLSPRFPARQVILYQIKTLDYLRCPVTVDHTERPDGVPNMFLRFDNIVQISFRYEVLSSHCLTSLGSFQAYKTVCPSSIVRRVLIR